MAAIIAEFLLYLLYAFLPDDERVNELGSGSKSPDWLKS